MSQHRFLKGFVLALMSTLLLSTNAVACPACTNLSLPMANTSSDTEFDSKAWYFRFDVTSSYFDYSHGVGVEDYEPGLLPSEQPSSHDLDFLIIQSTFDVSHSLSDRIRLGVSVPVKYTQVGASFRNQEGGPMPDTFESTHHRNESITGIGDVEVNGSFLLVQPPEREGFRLTGKAGFTIPTGRIEQDPYLLGRYGLEHQHIQYGTGIVSGKLGVSGSFVFPTWQLQGYVDSKLSFYDNKYGYQEGNRYSAGIGAQMDFGLRHWAFLAQVDYRHDETSVWETSPAELTGRREASFTAGVMYSPVPEWNLNLQITRPFFSEADAGKLVVPFSAGLGVQYNLYSLF